MKYIESLELREWVKDNLKKTIFQKAHALAVQTGCQILVKLEDDYDTTKHQYYATDKLRKVFKHNGLRQQPEEKFVSGVTGEPLIDQAIQSDGPGQIGELIGNLVNQGQRLGPESEVRSQGSGPEERLLDTDNVAGDEDTAIPMQLSMSAESFQSEGADDRTKETETTDNDISTNVKIKIEQMDDDPGGGSGDAGGSGVNVDHDASSTSMFGYDPNASSHSDLSSQFQSAPQATPIVQHPSSYQVPMSPKPYQCAMCGKAFRSVQVLQKHTQTFHMKTQHVMMGVRTGRGRGRGRPGFRFGAAQQQSQTSSFTCVMCNINFPEADILQDHMTRTHMGGATPQPQGSPADPNFSAPGTSQQSAVPSFSIPHTQSSPGGATPAAPQGSPFSPQGTPSSTPIFPRNVSSSPGSKPSTSTGTTRDFPKFASATEEINLINVATSHSDLNYMMVGGYTFRILTRSEPEHLKRIENGVKNKWCWNWLSKKDDNGDCLSQYLKKIDQPGLALCLWCGKQIRYGSSGKKAVEKHAQNKEHTQFKREQKETEQHRTLGQSLNS